MSKTCLLLFLVFATVNGFGQVLSVDERSLKGKIDPNNSAPIVVTVNDDTSYEFQKRKLDEIELFAELDTFLDSRGLESRAIFIKAEGKASFAKVVQLMRMGRRLNLDNFAFLDGGDSDPSSAIKVKIVLDEPPKMEPKPWARFLGVEILEENKLTLNRKPISDAQLIKSLRNIFAVRKKNRVYIEGSKDVDKSVFIKPLLSTKIESILSTIRSIDDAGAYPIAITIDWLRP